MRRGFRTAIVLYNRFDFLPQATHNCSSQAKQNEQPSVVCCVSHVKAKLVATLLRAPTVQDLRPLCQGL